MGWTEGTLLSKLIRRGAPKPALDPAAPGMTPRSRRSLHTGGATVVVVALIGGTVWLGAYFGVLPWRGALYEGPSSGWNKAKLHAAVGQEVAYTSLRVSNPSHVEVTLDSMTPSESPPHHLRLVTAWIATPASRCEAAADAGDLTALEAPSGCRAPVEGYVLPAGAPVGSGPRLVVVLSAGAPGQYVWKGFDIHYHVGPVSYTTTIASGFVMIVTAA